MPNPTCQFPGCGVALDRKPGSGRNPKWCAEHRAAKRASYGPDSPTKSCVVDLCDRLVRAKGLCNMHYRRQMRAEGAEWGSDSQPWNDRRRANWKRRYALSRGADDAESFDYREIFDRDNWTCGICSESVDRSLEWPDPLSASLDHIIPVSRGGKHTRDNAQCAHLTCNVSKGDRALA